MLKKHTYGFSIKAGMLKLFYFNGKSPAGWRGFRLHVCPKGKLMRELLGYSRRVYEL